MKINDKLRSNRGASLIMALVLFLICSVIGIVVLTSATAASGRASQLAENDQRYFSVASAAELLAGELNGQSVTIVRTRELERTTTTIYQVLADGSFSPAVSTEWELRYTTTIGDEAVNVEQPEEVVIGGFGDDPPTCPAAGGKAISLDAGDRSFLTALAVRLLFYVPPTAYDVTDDDAPVVGGDEGIKCNYDDAFDLSFQKSGNTVIAAGSFTLTHNRWADELAIRGEYVLREDGRLRITLWNEGEKDNYPLVLTLQPSFVPAQTRSREDETPEQEFHLDSETPWWRIKEKSSEKFEKKDTITWSVVSIGIGEKGEEA